MTKKIIQFSILVVLIIVYLSIAMFSYANTVSSDLKDSFFRLHIIANSNSDADQNLKIKVRDSVLEYMNSISKGCNSKNDVIALSNDNLDNFKVVAEKVVNEEGFDYPINVSIGTFYFPTKEYGNISLPAGNYDGLKIEIGKATGQNWWCSLFPPLCFVDISSGVIDDESNEKLKSDLNNEEYAIITNNSKGINFKFKLVELLSK